MNISLQDLINKYDAYFTADPEKWSGEERDKFCFDAVRTYQNIENILDAGCGNGHLLEYFYNIWGDTAKYTGLDMSPVACELARKKVPAAEIKCGLIEDTEFDNPFDVVVLLGVIEHMDPDDMEHKASLAAIRKLMTPSGILYIEAPNCISYRNSIHEEGFRQLSSRNRQFEWHLWRETWEKIFTDSGFEIIESLKGPVQEWEFVWILKRSE